MVIQRICRQWQCLLASEHRLLWQTKVWLNAQSTLTYSHDFGRNERNVELDGGAYFEVAKNREIPFYVNTETNQVRISGNTF